MHKIQKIQNTINIEEKIFLNRHKAEIKFKVNEMKKIEEPMFGFYVIVRSNTQLINQILQEFLRIHLTKNDLLSYLQDISSKFEYIYTFRPAELYESNDSQIHYKPFHFRSIKSKEMILKYQKYLSPMYIIEAIPLIDKLKDISNEDIVKMITPGNYHKLFKIGKSIDLYCQNSTLTMKDKLDNNVKRMERYFDKGKRQAKKSIGKYDLQDPNETGSNLISPDEPTNVLSPDTLLGQNKVQQQDKSLIDKGDKKAVVVNQSDLDPKQAFKDKKFLLSW